MKRWLAMLALALAAVGTGGSACAQDKAAPAAEATAKSGPITKEPQPDYGSPAPQKPLTGAPAQPQPVGDAPAAKPGPGAEAGSPMVAAPRVESVDILKQNQAERTRDQPGNLAPTWRQVKQGTPNYASLPYREASVLIQPKAQFPGQDRAVTAGEAWRQYRNGPMTQIGGWILIVTLLVLAAMYFLKGPIMLKHPRTGRLIERFTPTERVVHWTVAISFVILMVSGLTMMFGKHVLMPVFGHALFGYLTYALKTLHNFVGPLFAVSLIVMFITYVRDNFPIVADIRWLFTLGGAIGKGHPHAGRFNAGEKLWFWGGVTVLGAIVSASGFVLDHIVPGLDYTRALMQTTNIIHIVAAVLVMAAALGHIYLGTIGMEGAYRAMRDGYVDDEWAVEHHDLWYDDIQHGRVPRVRTQEGAATVAATAPKTV
ncbi:formate dehydrogenase subunit gamma [Massilia endophytica]|uniref:formate dehydrogenase subunit gamma n=1 Tax=Massilia endophytica TaxID=2899220 RepID=UPI001E577961|nr:formate dehydrogenase subunit gamma [Massilia endophytica]UGQ48111.1 formate dehydrogenase subunit gamma [Massilia endophytica]